MASDGDKSRTAILRWLSDLTPTERKSMIACFGGWTLDAFDAQVFSFVIPTLLAIWGISKGQAGLLAASTLVISAFGGWGAGAISDRIGRVRVLQVTIVWYALFTFLSGFAQNFEQLFICRALQGFGFGGEWSWLMSNGSAGREQAAKPTPQWVHLIDQGQNDPRLKGYFTPEGVKLEVVADFPDRKSVV